MMEFIPYTWTTDGTGETIWQGLRPVAFFPKGSDLFLDYHTGTWLPRDPVKPPVPEKSSRWETILALAVLVFFTTLPVWAQCTNQTTDLPYGMGPHEYSWVNAYDGFVRVGEVNEIQWIPVCHDGQQFYAVYYGAEGPEAFHSVALLFAEQYGDSEGVNIEIIGNIDLRGVSGVGLLWEDEQVKLDQSHTGYPPLPLWDFHGELNRLYW